MLWKCLRFHFFTQHDAPLLPSSYSDTANTHNALLQHIVLLEQSAPPSPLAAGEFLSFRKHLICVLLSCFFPFKTVSYTNYLPGLVSNINQTVFMIFHLRALPGQGFFISIRAMEHCVLGSLALPREHWSTNKRNGEVKGAETCVGVLSRHVCTVVFTGCSHACRFGKAVYHDQVMTVRARW